MRRSSVILSTLAVVALLGCAAGVAPWGPAHAETPDEAAPAAHDASPSPETREPLVTAVVALTNTERAKAGLPPLRPNESLIQAAQAYAGVLAPGPCFEHTCPPVPDLGDRVTRAGYAGYAWIGENIAAGRSTAAGVVQGWMDSPGHRANILRPEFHEIGVGVATGPGRYAIYWVQVFGARRQ